MLPSDEAVVSMDRWIVELSDELRRSPDVDVTVIAPPGAGAHRPRGQQVRRSVGRFAGYPLAVRNLEADVFHIVDHATAHLAAVLPSERVVVTCHDLMPLMAASGEVPFSIGRMTLARVRFSVSFLRRVAHVACVSESTRSDVISRLGVAPGNTSVIPPGLDRRFRPFEPKARAAARATFGRSPDAKLLLHVSSGFAHKNAGGALEVLSRLRAEGIDAVLVRVGVPLSPPERDLAGRLGILDAVLDLGRVSDERLVEIYNGVDTVLIPSHSEGFGWPAVEALACGTSVATSTASAVLEAVDGAGVSAPADDPDALAAAVLSLWRSPSLRHSLRERGLARAATLSWRRAAERYLEIYAALATR